MHPGGTLCARVFQQYQVLPRPLVVHFAKKSIIASAVGVGEMILHGCSGLVVLLEVQCWHMPAENLVRFSRKTRQHR
jgi:hypothetical protein